MDVNKIIYILFVIIIIYVLFNIISASFKSVVLIAIGVIIGLYFYNNINNIININYVIDTIKNYNKNSD
jgi:hypothetical protein